MIKNIYNSKDNRYMSYEIKVPHAIKILQDIPLSNLVGQLQSYSPKLLCVINGNILHYYDKSSTMPNNLRFERKQRHDDITEYYFRDIDDGTRYCVFGRDSAKHFFPRIDEVDPILKTQKQINYHTKKYIPPSDKIVTINDNGNKICFTVPNYPVEKKTFTLY